jgi:hypothetical protein
MVNLKVKKALYELSKKKCEVCSKEFEMKDIEIHRVRRRNQGGTYQWRNCMVLCKCCHRLIHGREFT